MKTPKFLDESVCICCKKVLGVALSCVFFCFGLVLKNFCVKEMMKFQRSCCQKVFKPLFCFGYKLSYSNLN